MTENEAIEVLNNFDMQVSAKADGAYQSTIGEMACKVAVKVLAEIQQYRAIGTVKECLEARERIEVMSNTENREETCFIPEKDNPYPLCVGRGEEKCKDCQIRADWEPEDPFGVE